jgi:hypothetical protein
MFITQIIMKYKNAINGEHFVGIRVEKFYITNLLVSNRHSKFFKGTVSRNGFGFLSQWLVRSLNIGLRWFFNFLGAPMILK